MCDPLLQDVCLLFYIIILLITFFSSSCAAQCFVHYCVFVFSSSYIAIVLFKPSMDVFSCSILSQHECGLDNSIYSCYCL